ncbi:MAG TPA: tetratricopeptide repeat protein [Anaerolineales bacterium]|nr:tetratricopeptide repeat protein [Anaerolineales bacterium]
MGTGTGAGQSVPGSTRRDTGVRNQAGQPTVPRGGDATVRDAGQRATDDRRGVAGDHILRAGDGKQPVKRQESDAKRQTPNVMRGRAMEEKTDAEALKAEGLRLFEEGLYEEAAKRFGQAQELFAAGGNLAEAAEMLNNLGVTYRMLHQWDQARVALEEAQRAFARLGDRDREAQTLGNLGGLLATRGDRLRAQEYLRRAADIFEELGDRQRQGETLISLGIQMWKAGDRRGGLKTYREGLQILENPNPQQRFILRLLGWLFWLLRWPL